MEPPLIPVDLAALSAFHVVHVRDPAEMDANSRVSRRLPGESVLFSHRLQDRSLLRTRFKHPITTIANRPLGSMSISLGGDRFASQVDIEGSGINRYCFTMMFNGKSRLVQNGNETTVCGTDGLVFRGRPGRG